MKNQTKTYHLLTTLFHYLETEGTPISTRKYLQVQQLLEKIDPDTPSSDLKLMLAALLTTNKEEQEYFYKLYDRVEGEVNAIDTKAAIKEPPPPPPPGRNKWLPYLIGVGIILLGVVVWLRMEWLDDIVKELNKTREYINLYVYTDSFAIQQIDFPLDDAELGYISLGDGSMFGETPNYGRYKLDTSGRLRFTAFSQVGQQVDSIMVIANFEEIRRDTVYFIPTIEERPEPPPPVEQLDTLAYKTYPHAADMNRLILSPPTEWQEFWNKYGLFVKLGLTALLLLLAYFFTQWLNRRREIIAEQDSTDKPPFVWNIEIDGEEDIVFSDGYYKALNQLRQRSDDDFFKLSMPKTIKATIDNGGMIDLRYEQQTKPTEYLLLIDRQSAKNHRARLFDLVYKSFRENEVIVERFYYDSDIRVCYNETHRFGISIKEVLQQHSRSRLLILGNAYQLFNPRSGKLARWTKLFDGWKEKAVLTPTGTQKWGRKERQLATQFFVFPSTMDGFRLSIDAFESANNADLLRTRQLPTETLAPIVFEDDLITTIKYNFPNAFTQPSHLGDMGVWIAACAIYPTLHWDLTIHLGQQLSTEETPLLTIENIMHLSRLPWFVEGKIPEASREVLLQWLADNAPDLELQLRESINNLLQESEPPKDSVAYDDYRMNMVINELLYTKDPDKQKELEEEFKALLDKGVEHDFTIIKYLDRKKKRTDLLIPKPLHRYFHPSLGYKYPLWLIPIILILLGGLWIYNPKMPTCSGESITYKGKDFCIHPDSLEHKMIYWDHLTRDFIKEEIWEDTQNPADSLIAIAKDFAIANNLDTIPYIENITTAYYNKGGEFYNYYLDLLTQQTGIGETREMACHFFEKAFSLDSLDFDLLKMVAECRGIDINLQIANRIRGEVRDNSTGRLINDFTITHATQTNNIRNLRDGTYELRLQNYQEPTISLTFNAQGYATKTETLPIDSNRTTLTVVRLIPSTTPQSEQVTISGIVTSDGSPFQEVKVTAKGQSTTTDTEGRYSLTFTPNASDNGRTLVEIRKDFYIPFRQQVSWQNNRQIILNAELELNPDAIPKNTYELNGTITSGSDLLDDVKISTPYGSETTVKGDFLLTVEAPQDVNSFVATISLDGYKTQTRTITEATTTLNITLEKESNVPLPEMISVQGGTFQMGCDPNRDGTCFSDGRVEPLHQVTVSNYSIGKYEVTNEQFAAFLNAKGNQEEGGRTWVLFDDYVGLEENNSEFKPKEGMAKHPMVNVSWYGARAYCNWLKEVTGQNYRLPTEAEWEYAARGGNRSQGYTYSGSNTIDEVAWYNGNSGSKTHEVGTKNSNELGIFDMSGNVYEWCEDIWHDDYTGAPTDGSAWMSGGNDSPRVLRGGSWSSNADYCRSASRVDFIPFNRGYDYGFRVALS